MRVVRQILRGKTDLAHRRVNQPGLVEPKFHFTGLDFLDGLRHVRRDRASLRVRHQAARPQHFSQLAGRTHHVRRRDHCFVIRPAALNLLHHIFAAHKIRAPLPAPRELFHRRRSPPRASIFPAHAAAPPCRAPSGPTASSPHPSSKPARLSHRTSRNGLCGAVPRLLPACMDAPRPACAPDRYFSRRLFRTTHRLFSPAQSIRACVRIFGLLRVLQNYSVISTPMLRARAAD